VSTAPAAPMVWTKAWGSAGNVMAMTVANQFDLIDASV